jgi:hypothetical protein
MFVVTKSQEEIHTLAMIVVYLNDKNLITIHDISDAKDMQTSAPIANGRLELSHHVSL